MRALLKYLTFVVTLAAGAQPGRADGVIVFAASSLTNALDAANSAYGGPQPRVAYAASSVLARQIAQGAPAEIIISANPDWMDYLEGEGAIDARSRVDLVTNRLVVIAGADDAMPMDGLKSLPDRLGSGRLALALTEAVPAGIYAREALTAAGIWPEIMGKTAQTDNVRAALQLVARGEAPLGIVYATDIAASDRVAVVAEIDPALHAPIVYTAALTSLATAQGRAYFDYLVSPAVARIFGEHGFGVGR